MMKNLDRVTNFTGKVSDYTLAQLKEADLGYHFFDLEGATFL